MYPCIGVSLPESNLITFQSFCNLVELLWFSENEKASDSIKAHYFTPCEVIDAVSKNPIFRVPEFNPSVYFISPAILMTPYSWLVVELTAPLMMFTFID